MDRATTSDADNGKHPNPQFSAAMAENPSEKLTFSGRVVDGDGEPVADAEIWYSVKLNPSESVARTVGDGTFRFESPQLEFKEWDRASIIATHSDHALGWRNLQPQNNADVEIRLETQEVISGRILNEDGAPIQNAEARIQALFSGNPAVLGRDSNLAIDEIPISIATTNANGEFVLRGLPQGATTNLETQGPGYAKELHSMVSAGTKGLEFRLEREGRIDGHLSYADTGAPVNDATVMLEGIYPTTGWGRTRVDAKGNYLLTNLAPGFYNLYLYKGPEGWTAVAKELIKVVKGQTVSNIDLTLVRGGFITGRVINQENTEPIANHHISFHDAARPESQAAVHGTETDATGVYRFRAAPGRALVYTAAPQGYVDIGQIRRYVDVVEGKTVAVDFQFSKGVELAGRTLTEAGEPVPGALVSDREGFSTYGKSNDLGEITIGGQRLGEKLRLKAEHDSLRLRGMTEVEVEPNGVAEIRLQSYERTKISGRVVNRDGNPISSVNIDLMRWDSLRSMVTRSTVAVTDGDGWFREVVLIVGDEYTISAKTAGYQEAETARFTATPEMTQIADLVMLPVVGQFFIEGRVTDSAGKPVHGARLHISQSKWKDTLTDESGNYRFEDLSMAVVNEVDVYHPDYAVHQFKILQANQRHDLVLIKADGYIAGRVVDADGNPIQRATVMIDPQEDPISGILYPAVDTNGQGEFELEYIKDPTVSIYVSNDRGYRIFEDVKVNQRNLVLTLTPTEPGPAPTPEQKARWAYAEESEERFKALVGKPAPELAVSEWLSGTPTSIETLKGKTIALYFWHLGNSDHIQSIRLLNILREVYGEKGLVCVTICPAKTAIETVKRQIVEHSLTYPIGLDSPTDIAGAKGKTFNQYAVGWIRPIILINAAGEITGSVYGAQLENQIQIMLAD